MNQTFSRLYASQLVTGRGSLSFLATLEKKKAAIIYDGRIIGEEKQRQITHMLNTGGCEVRFVADIRNEPFFSDITSAGEELRSYEPDLFVAIGGGSVMDTTKAMWLFYEHPEQQHIGSEEQLECSQRKHWRVEPLHLVDITITSIIISRA